MSTKITESLIPTLHEHDMFNDNTVAGFVIETNGAAGPHAHDWLEIAVTSSGTGHHVTAQGQRPAQPGDVFILRPGTWHDYTACHQLINGYVCIAASALHGEAAFLHDIPAVRDLLLLRPASAGHYGVYSLQVPEPSAHDVVRQIAALRSDLAERPANRPLVLGRLLTILGALAEHVVADTTGREPHPAVATVLAHLDAQPEHDWRIDELAATVNVDSAYLSRLFRQHLGLPPIAYLARVRAERAAGLLARTSEPVSRIGALVGWPNPVHFTRRFRALAGLTPTEYRDRSRNNPIGPIDSIRQVQP